MATEPLPDGVPKLANGDHVDGWMYSEEREQQKGDERAQLPSSRNRIRSRIFEIKLRPLPRVHQSQKRPSAFRTGGSRKRATIGSECPQHTAQGCQGRSPTRI
jgi:hypothetical protein